MLSSLFVADLPEWRTLRFYNRLVAARLRRAYSHIASRPTQLVNYFKAHGLARDCIGAPAAAPQKLRLMWILAQAHAAVDDPKVALYWIDDAIELAVNLEDISALADLHYLRGNIHHQMLHCREACTDLDECLNSLHYHGAMPDRQQLVFEAQVNTQIGSLHVLLGNMAQAQARFDIARHLLRNVPRHRLEWITVEQAEAHLHRLGGRPDLARVPAMVAADTYKARGDLRSAARLYSFTAEVELDWAEYIPVGTVHGSLMQVAQRHIDAALECAERAGDENAKGLAIIPRVRVSRMLGKPSPGIAELEQVATLGRQTGSIALEAQALTAMAQAYAAQKNPEAAIDRYRRVLETLKGSDLLSLAVEARWALRRNGPRE